ncbi:transcriptional regulator [Salmonella enterica subsp. enterica serovar Typhimurium]|nr:transcriptional regulator [Salmonella enterica subsp. enterica serovar Typhimurium]EBY8246130.1 transcriptional regulator [Salmonella enterica subsp. enterica serovar Typhimurium]
MKEANIRLECLRPAQDGWQQPTADEVQEVLRVGGFHKNQAASLLGLGESGDRTIRRWTSGETLISYANWALLCDFAGLGVIWKEEGLNAKGKFSG